ncbi:bifunctional phosphoglucose/phosphomannose isomerase [Candidatus Bathyarchaeota archaeon]|nr:bifunctional phosphoglucose/phosphomannose isomerase [Candidatus Bathyarchaeota archaeon]
MSSILDDETRIASVDTFNMRRIAEKFPELCEDALALCRDLKIPHEIQVNSRVTIGYSRPREVIVTGMGGSAIGGDLFKGWVRDRFNSPIEVCRGYHLPKYAGPNTLVIAISYSGNTEETLNSFVEAVERGCMTFSVSSGGLLEEFNHTLGLPHLRIPSAYPPRSALPYLFFPLTASLQRLGALSNFDVEVAEAINTLKNIREEICTASPSETNPSKKLAIDIEGLIPMVCGFGPFEAVASRIKTQFNENSKTPAKAEFFPEMNHNETLGWSGLRKLTKIFGVVLIRSNDEPPEIRTRIEVTRELVLIDGAGKVVEIWAKGSGRLGKMLSAMYIGDFASIYLGILYGIDPTPISVIDNLKSRLEERLNRAAELAERVNKLKP